MARARTSLRDSAGITGRATATAPARGIVGALAAPIVTPDATARLDDLAPNPANPRTELGDLDELAASIEAAGLVQPLVVASAAVWIAARPGDAGGLAGRPWVIIAGHRRHAAARIAGVDTVPIAVRDDLAEHVTRSALIENIHRAALPPLDEAAALQELIDGGMSQRQIAKATGISQPKISKRLALLTLPAQARADLSAGELVLAGALRLLEVPADLRAAVYAASTEHAGWTLERAVQVTKSRLAVQARDQELREQAERDGILVIADPAAQFGAAAAYAHHLWDDTDIAEATARGVCLAHIDHGRVEYYATTSKPWPWQHLPQPPDSTPPTEQRDEQPPGEPFVDPHRGPAAARRAAAETDRRLTAIHRWLHDPTIPDSDRGAVLARLVSITETGVDQEEPDTVARLLLGRSDWDWNDYAAAGFAAASTDTGPDTGPTPLLFAAAKLISTAETWIDFDNSDDAGERARNGIYLDVLAGIGYTPSDSAGITLSSGDEH